MKINIAMYSNSDIMPGVYTQHHMFGYWAHGKIYLIKKQYQFSIYNEYGFSSEQYCLQLDEITVGMYII